MTVSRYATTITTFENVTFFVVVMYVSLGITLQNINTQRLSTQCFWPISWDPAAASAVAAVAAAATSKRLGQSRQR